MFNDEETAIPTYGSRSQQGAQSRLPPNQSAQSAFSQNQPEPPRRFQPTAGSNVRLNNPAALLVFWMVLLKIGKPKKIEAKISDFFFWVFMVWFLFVVYLSFGVAGGNVGLAQSTPFVTWLKLISLESKEIFSFFLYIGAIASVIAIYRIFVNSGGANDENKLTIRVPEKVRGVLATAAFILFLFCNIVVFNVEVSAEQGWLAISIEKKETPYAMLNGGVDATASAKSPNQSQSK